jgi:ribosome maturation factor RimP
MELIKDKIVSVAEQAIADSNLLLIDIVLRGNEQHRVIEIFIDGEMNVSAETCAEISRQMTKIINDENLIESAYRLDVSTPGVERPLKFFTQYKKHINRKFAIEYKADDIIRKFEGRLIGIQDDVLIFDSGKEIHIKFNSIVKAVVLVSFS